MFFSADKPSPAIVALAKTLEDRGMTSPEKHNLNIVKFGERIFVAEVGHGETHLEVHSGETTIRKFKRMLKTLPTNHNLGLVTIIVGNDLISDGFKAFVVGYAKRKNFGVMTMVGTLPTRQIFENCLKTPETVGSA